MSEENNAILLINLPTGIWYKEDFSKSNSMPPLGLLCLHAMATVSGFECNVIDLAVENLNKDKFEADIRALNPKIIGFSTYNESWNELKALSKYIKQIIPDCFIIAGGAFATFCDEDILKESDCDFVIKGEGELPFIELCNLILNEKTEKGLDEIKGLSYIDDEGNIRSNNTLNRIDNLDELPFVNRSVIDLNKYTIPYTISTSRGCPGDCIFCSSRAFWGGKVKFRSAENIFEEVTQIKQKYNSNYFYITDDTFTISRANCLKFCEMLSNCKYKFIWGCESRADVVDEHLIKKMHEAGCRKIQFGFESADNEILKKLKKKVTIEQIENATRLAHKYKMHIQLSYIIGHAFDTKETVEKTINKAIYFQNKYGAHIATSINTPFPGTEQYINSEEYGIKIDTNDWSQYTLGSAIIETNNLSKADILKYYSYAQKNKIKNSVELHTLGGNESNG